MKNYVSNFSIDGHLIYVRDTELAEDFASEESARVAADNALGDRITAEAGTRETNDNFLGSRIDNEVGAREAADGELSDRITAIQSAVGSPLVATSSDGMTDHTKVYVYAGTTGGGLTNGHWYYWNGSAWADGGVYNSEGINTDTTLAVSGAAADAKATGDAIDFVGTSVKGIGVIGKIRMAQRLNKFINGVTHIIDTMNLNTAITTEDIIYTDHAIQINCPSGYRYVVSYYSTNTWATAYYLNNSGWVTGKYVIPANSYFAIQFGVVNSGTFTAESQKNLLEIDEIITLENMVNAIAPYNVAYGEMSFHLSQKINKGIDGVTFLLVDRSNNDRITTAQVQYAEHDVALSCPAGYRFAVDLYSTNGFSTANHVKSSGWQTREYTIPAGYYYAVQFGKTDGSALSSENDKMLLEYASFAYRDIYDYLSEVSGIVEFRKAQELNAFVNGITFELDHLNNGKIITTNKILYAKSNITLDCSSDYKYVVHYYKSATWTTANHVKSTGYLSGKYTIEKGSYYVVQLTTSDDSVLTNGEADKIAVKFQDVVKEDNTLYHIIVTGQSLAVGSEGNPALTTQTPLEYIGKCYQFNGGSRPTDGQVNDTGAETIPVSDACLENFGSLFEQNHTLELDDNGTTRLGYQGETIDSAMGYWFSELTGKHVLVSNHAVGGLGYIGLRKGTVPYANSIRAVKHAKEICNRLGWNYKVFAVAVVHGEADTDAGISAADYAVYMYQWQNDYDSDIKAITGQVENVQMFMSQTASSSKYNKTYGTVANGTFLAAVNDPDIHLVCPLYSYPLTYASVHMNNYGYRFLGEFFGNIMGRYFNGQLDPALYPVSSTLTSNVISISFNNVPTLASLAYDGSNVSAVSDGNWGFELVDDINGVSITGVSIDNNTIHVTLSGAPSGDAKISYAYKSLSDELGKIGASEGVRGNLRNTWSFNTMFDDTGVTECPMWCAIFCVPVSWSIS